MTMQQFISCLMSFEWLQPHPTHRKNSFLPTPHIQTYVKSMTHWLNDVLMSGKADVGWLEFNPVAVVIEQLSNDLVEDLPLKENNLHRLYNVPYPVEDEVLVGERRDWGLEIRQIRQSVKSFLVSFFLLWVPEVKVH